MRSGATAAIKDVKSWSLPKDLGAVAWHLNQGYAESYEVDDCAEALTHNWQTTNRQLSDNYQTTIRQLSDKYKKPKGLYSGEKRKYLVNPF